MTDLDPDLMPQEAVEAVARAIYQDRNGSGARGWHTLPETHRRPYRSDARAAIEAYLANRKAAGFEMLRTSLVTQTEETEQ